MVRFNRFLVSLLLFINYNPSVYCVESNNLLNLVINVSNLSDEFLFYFEKNSPMIYYKDSAVNNIVNNSKIQEAVFLVPGVLIKDMDKILEPLKNLNGNYKLRFESCDKPVRGIKIILSYNPEDLNLQYGQIKESAVIFFRLYKKEALNLINHKTSTFRWYAKSVNNLTIYKSISNYFQFTCA